MNRWYIANGGSKPMDLAAAGSRWIVKNKGVLAMPSKQHAEMWFGKDYRAVKEYMRKRGVMVVTYSDLKESGRVNANLLGLFPNEDNVETVESLEHGGDVMLVEGLRFNLGEWATTYGAFEYEEE